MRDPPPNAALPRAPDARPQEGRGAADGERPMAALTNEIRCPYCQKKLAEGLRGTITIICPRPACKRRVTITR